MISEKPFQYQECKLDHSLGVGRDSVTGNSPSIPDSSLWASTYTTEKRKPNMARLDDPTGTYKLTAKNVFKYFNKSVTVICIAKL